MKYDNRLPYEPRTASMAGHLEPSGVNVAIENLEDLLESHGNPVEMLRNAAVPGYSYPLSYPGVPGEFTNWLEEQRAWRQTCAFFDLSHHMTDLLIEGPDASALLSALAINGFANFEVDRAKQMVVCNYDGFVIGDGILFRLSDHLYEFVGRASVANWIEFHARGYDVQMDRDNPTSAVLDRPAKRRFFRYQLQGPNAEGLIEKLNGGPYGDIKFFRMGNIGVAGRKVRALRHGMSGQPGLEIFGPYEEGEEIRAAILEAGEEFGVLHVGARAYPTDTLESGWIPSPLPAIYTGAEMESYRRWLPADCPEGTRNSLGGSFVSADVEDYYLTPYELGYGSFINFDHDFIGREALHEMDRSTQRRKVTLAWKGEDVTRVFASLFDPDQVPYKYIDLPLSNYAGASYDLVAKEGRAVGYSMYSGYSYNERSMLSLAVVDSDLAVGEEVTVLWGEPNGGSNKLTVESPHRQIEIRARVSPVPYSSYARDHYAEGWRTTQKP
jgi:vanillate/3-O-methylgallate O-demethylase